MISYDTTKRGYANLWAKAGIRPERQAAAERIARQLNANCARYQAVGRNVVPWYWIATVHNLEAGQSFRTHLHNGDSLATRTVHVPAGRPASGEPPFTWEESAQDALNLKGLYDVPDWPIARCLYEFERYNGFGYVARGVNSPYVWSFTDLYSRGKYVADGRYDPSAVSQQCGAAATLKAMEKLRFITLAAPALTEDQKQAIQLDKPITPVKMPKAPEWDIVGWIIAAIKRFFI